MSKIIFACGILVSAWVASLQAQTATVTTTPGTLSFTYQSGSSTLPKAQSVAVKPSTGKPTFTTSTPPADFWLTVNMDSGTLPTAVGVEVNPTSLAVGTYTSSVTFTVAGVGSPAVITVTLQITAAPSTLAVTPSTLIFTAPPSPSIAQTLTLSTNGSPISFTATSGVPWMTVTPHDRYCFTGRADPPGSHRECRDIGAPGGPVRREHHRGGFRGQRNREIAKRSIVDVTSE